MTLRTALDDFNIPRKSTPDSAKEAFDNLKAQDFEPHKPYSPEEFKEAMTLLCAMCGLVEGECVYETRHSIRVGARTLLKSVTLAEAKSALESFDEKTRAWWALNGQPVGAAKVIASEVSRRRSQAYRNSEAGDESRRRRYLDWLD